MTIDVDKLYRNVTDYGENDHRYVIFCRCL